MMSRTYYFTLFATLVTLASGCYEDRIACLDPDATNYDLRADDQCPDDCCVYPSLNLELSRVWGDAPFSVDSTYTDGSGNEFKIQRLRVYLGDLLVESSAGTIPAPENETEIGRLVEGDTVLMDVNANLVLATATGATTLRIGSFRNNNQPISGLSGTVGLSDAFASLIPSTAPAAAPLAIQPGLLRFNDGRGYVSASLEYVLVATDDTVRVDSYRDAPFTLSLPTPVLPARGSSLTLLTQFDLERLFTDLNLAENRSTWDARPEEAISLTGAR